MRQERRDRKWLWLILLGAGCTAQLLGPAASPHPLHPAADVALADVEEGTSIAEKMGCTAETLRRWVLRAERDGGTRARPTTAERERVKELERELHDDRRWIFDRARGWASCAVAGGGGRARSWSVLR